MEQTKKVGGKSTVTNKTIQRVDGEVVTETSSTKITLDVMIYDGTKWVVQKEVTSN
jgi:hypothetical protein